MDTRINTTIETFGYPRTLVADLGSWLVLLRPRQVTLGSLVLAAAHPAESFAGLPAESFAGLGAAVGKAEAALRGGLGCAKINYLMLMMVDPHVHFHVIPRYDAAPRFQGVSYPDPFWPRPPDVTSALDVAPDAFEALRRHLAGAMGGEGQ